MVWDGKGWKRRFGRGGTCKPGCRGMWDILVFLMRKGRGESG